MDGLTGENLLSRNIACSFLGFFAWLIVGSLSPTLRCKKEKNSWELVPQLVHMSISFEGVKYFSEPILRVPPPSEIVRSWSNMQTYSNSIFWLEYLLTSSSVYDTLSFIPSLADKFRKVFGTKRAVKTWFAKRGNLYTVRTVYLISYIYMAGGGTRHDGGAGEGILF